MWLTKKDGCRDYTNELLERVNQGLLTWEQIAQAALQYMSEDDVKDMAESNELIEDDDEEEEEEEDDDEEDCFEVDDEFKEAYEKGEEQKSCRICAYWDDTAGHCMIGRERED